MRRWLGDRASDVVFIALLFVLCAMCAAVVLQFSRNASARPAATELDLATVYDPPASETEG